MSMVNEKVMEKLRKVLRLAGDAGATQGEIEAAMAAARKIAMEHNIELGSVDMNADAEKASTEIHSDEDLKIKAAFERKYHGWIFYLANKIFEVRVFVSRQKHGSRHRISKVWVIGDATDVAMAKAIISWLEDLYPKSYLQAVNNFEIINDAAAQHGYYRGLTAGILEANRKEEAKQKAAMSTSDANKYAMVVRNKETAIEQRCKEMFPEWAKEKEEEEAKPEDKKKKQRDVNYSNTAAALGYARGRSINLSQMGNGSQSKGQLQ